MELTPEKYIRLKRIINNCKALCKSSNPFELCKILNIKIYFLPLENGLFGFADISSSDEQPLKSKATIFISSCVSSYAQKIICAHELGHILLQRDQSLNLLDSSNPSNSISEYEANLFAIELLPQIYIGVKDYRCLSREELYNYMIKKLSHTFFTLKSDNT